MSVKIPSEIRKIVLDDASFKGTGTTIDNLTFVNFFFGNNGSGKSTIAQAIKSGKGITYARGNTASDYLPLVYDESFINLNFHSYKNMPGVFTINEVNTSIQEQIDALHKKENDFKAKIDDAEGTIEQKKNYLDNLGRNFGFKFIYEMFDIKITNISAYIIYGFKIKSKLI